MFAISTLTVLSVRNGGPAGASPPHDAANITAAATIAVLVRISSPHAVTAAPASRPRHSRSDRQAAPAPDAAAFAGAAPAAQRAAPAPEFGEGRRRWAIADHRSSAPADGATAPRSPDPGPTAGRSRVRSSARGRDYIVARRPRCPPRRTYNGRTSRSTRMPRACRAGPPRLRRRTAHRGRSTP